MSNKRETIHYPRRHLIRWLLKLLARLAVASLIKLRIENLENLPQKGPFMLVGNHFAFVDFVIVLAKTPWLVEVLGDYEMPNVPGYLKWIPRAWGALPVNQGIASRHSLRAAQQVLEQDGFVMVFPEGRLADRPKNPVLSEGNPGAAYIAIRSGCPILPIGFDGTFDIFPSLAKGKRADVTVRIGEPFGPFNLEPGQKRQERMNEVHELIMKKIAALLPPERRGVYS
jgi:1-acyl-sn-glycerol-3-phosphate acyltransferase